MSSELRDEDHKLAQRLAGRRSGPPGDVDASAVPAIGNRAGYIGAGVSAVSDPQPSEQKALEQALKTASSITICGVAPRSLIEAMQRIAKQGSTADGSLTWRRITYITPAAPLVFATRGSARLGSVVQKWQSALNGIRNCVQQVQSDFNAMDGTPSVELSLLGVTELFLEVVLLIREHDTGQERLWVSVGPNLARDDALYLVFDKGTEYFDKISVVVHHLGGDSKPIVSRQLEMAPDDELEDAFQTSAPPHLPALEVRSLQPVGTFVPPPSCLPAAVTVLRSAAAGKPIVLLKRRTRFTDADDFDKLSLLSARLLEEDLAGALRVPLFTDRDANYALDAMWKAYGKPRQLPISIDAFIRAAQRDVFVTCGLDIPADRFVHRGCHYLEREESGLYLFFCVFEVVLYRHRGDDELELAEAWNPEQLERVNEDALYGANYKQELNRLLLRRQKWLQDTIFSAPIDIIEEFKA